MRTLSLLILFLSTFLFAQVPKELLEFFQRSGYVVEKEGEKVLIDLPRGKAFPGEIFEVFQSKKPIIHPVTKKVLGYKEEKVGEVEVIKPRENFSEAKTLENNGIKPGDRVKLKIGSVCYIGGDEGYYALSQVVQNVKRNSENCDYVVKELENGYGVSYKGKPLAFFQYSGVGFAKRGGVFEDFALKAKFVRSLESLPLSADICKLFGKKDYLVVLFSDKVKVYEVLKTDFVEVLSYAIPTGYPVGVVCYENKGRSAVLVNMISNGEASSAVLSPVGNSLMLTDKNVPYLFGFFYQNGKKVLIGQEFKGSWGKVYRFELRGDKLVRKDALNLPEDFRVDGANAWNNVLVFVDNDGQLRVYVNDEEVLTEDGFGLSYTTAEVPGVYEYAEGDKYGFYVRPNFTKVYKDVLPLIAKNRASNIFQLVGFTKFTEGELWTVVRKKEKVYEAIKLKGRKFEEAIQAIVRDSEGRIFVITGSKGTIPIQNRGEVYLIEITPL
ncbi:hypothetical protein [Aquifex aeolicus]|uniref:Uncharacterized protein aq_243 n=1 Tax=Aquifex aeolicus (strain VF5) TaxID=224324 RepID=Y243_AQUAE|nr:hypothetical protein [Aquifex aeolicus]O66606.1 RecName: Full=Uncharacterized protein aq_243; Flags: Precursor [Aquifex aeolicus VF5]AAC06570.1 putative protein [Aquifex aeolicus VF5]